MFNEIKTAQVAMLFLGKTQEGRMSHLKLMKLMYLADREAVFRTGLPITWDHPVSMPHGPVLSMTLDLMNGNVSSPPGGWEDLISAKENNEISARVAFDARFLTKLSEAEIDVLEFVWGRFGRMGKWEIRDWTHENCPEWEDPDGSSRPITFHTLARSVGFNEDAATELANLVAAGQEIDKLFASL
ncbi:MAG: SocA family protein [Magnetococcales bacterium]|nr:SocA family protein [Magnetococcales bacterium]